MTCVASFHLFTFKRRHLLTHLLALPADRWELAETPGIGFARVMGTSKTGTTKTSVEWGRWCLFLTWENEDALRMWMESSSLLARWNRTAETVSTHVLQPLTSRGTWSDDPLFTAFEAAPEGSRVAVLTRARVRPRSWWTFSRAIRPVDDRLREQPGCSLALGMGEWPVGEQATFSIWDSADALEHFAYRSKEHHEVIKRTYREHWYSEELFARFAVLPFESRFPPSRE